MPANARGRVGSGSKMYRAGLIYDLVNVEAPKSSIKLIDISTHDTVDKNRGGQDMIPAELIDQDVIKITVNLHESSTPTYQANIAAFPEPNGPTWTGIRFGKSVTGAKGCIFYSILQDIQETLPFEDKMTFVLTLKPVGAVTRGVWATISAYTPPTNPDAPTSPFLTSAPPSFGSGYVTTALG